MLQGSVQYEGQALPSYDSIDPQSPTGVSALQHVHTSKCMQQTAAGQACRRAAWEDQKFPSFPAFPAFQLSTNPPTRPPMLPHPPTHPTHPPSLLPWLASALQVGEVDLLSYSSAPFSLHTVTPPRHVMAELAASVASRLRM